MTADIRNESELRQWLIDYFVTVVGCDAAELDPDVTLTDSSDWALVTRFRRRVKCRTCSADGFLRSTSGSFPRSALCRVISQRREAPSETSPVVEAAINEPIAVVGLGCRFPGDIYGPEALWQFLCQGRNAIRRIPRLVAAVRRWFTGHGGDDRPDHAMGLVSERCRRF